MNSYTTAQRYMAFVAGLSLILMALVSGFSYGYALPRAGWNPGSTMLLTSTGFMWLRYGIAGFVAVLMLDVLVAWSLYFFLLPAGRRLSLLSSSLRLVYAALFGAALYPLLQARPQITGDQLQLYFDAFRDMWALSLIVSAGHLGVLGTLSLRSGYVPRICGVLALVASVCYIATSLMQLLWPGYSDHRPAVEQALTLPMAAGELALAFWLAGRGGRQKGSYRRTISAA